jgi:hemolysin activation/secretion protein
MRWQGLYKFQIKFALVVVLLITLHPVCSSGDNNDNQQQQHRHQQQQQQQFKPPPTPPNIKVPSPGVTVKPRNGGEHMPSKSSYAMLSEAMSQAVNHEFSE